MSRAMLWLGAALLPVFLWAAEAGAADSRILITAQDRQLRAVEVEAVGYAGPGAGDTRNGKRAAALAEARRQAVAKVKRELTAEIRDKGLDLTFGFAGRSPEEAVFVRRVEDIPESQATRQGVRIQAQVVYVLVFPAEWTSFQAGEAKALKMRSAGEETGSPQGAMDRIEEKDLKYLEQFLLLEQGLKQKLEGLAGEAKEKKTE